MSKKSKDIQKVISKETKLIAEKYASKHTENLTIKISPREIKTSLKYNYSEHRPLPKFSNDYIAQLNSFVEYIAMDAENIEIEFDKDCNPIYLEEFKKAWKQHFALKIYRKDKDIKEIRRKNVTSIVFGILCLLVVIGFSVASVFYTSKPFQIVAIVMDAIFSILSWVLIWEFFYDIIYVLPDMKQRIIVLYKMYKVDMGGKK